MLGRGHLIHRIKIAALIITNLILVAGLLVMVIL